MLRVLINAYACNPYKGSEEGVGWGWVKAISQFAETWVLVAEYHRADIEHYQRQHTDELRSVHFEFVPHRWWHYQPTPLWQRIEGSVAKPIMNIAYALWLRDAFRLAQRLHRQHSFDLAHQLTYVGFRFPGHLWKLGIPFVWGPLGGLENTPWRFLPVMGWYGATYYAGRNLINSAQRWLLRSPKHAARAAGRGVIAATSGIQREIKRWLGADSSVICEVGPAVEAVITPTSRKEGEALRLVWSGQHLPGKALPLLLEALSQLPESVSWQLDVLGGGSKTSSWQKIADSLGLSERIGWRGLLPRQSALQVMQEGHVFVITSLKDLTSSVLLEALSLGLPVICPDHCGFSDVVSADCGFKLPLHDPNQFSRDVAVALQVLATDEPLRLRLAQGALHRVTHYTWEKKAKQIQEIYQQVVADG